MHDRTHIRMTGMLDSEDVFIAQKLAVCKDVSRLNFLIWLRRDEDIRHLLIHGAKNEMVNEEA